ncbi:MAG: hypothetical protein ACOYW7_02740 [Nitrospirota bacterium]
MSRDSKALREKARKLLADAERIENEMARKVGKLTMKYFSRELTDISDADLREFKAELDKLQKED